MWEVAALRMLRRSIARVCEVMASFGHACRIDARVPRARVVRATTDP